MKKAIELKDIMGIIVSYRAAILLDKAMEVKDLQGADYLFSPQA